MLIMYCCSLVALLIKEVNVEDATSPMVNITSFWPGAVKKKKEYHRGYWPSEGPAIVSSFIASKIPTRYPCERVYRSDCL
jgi:hypothetical protein